MPKLVQVQPGVTKPQIELDPPAGLREDGAGQALWLSVQREYRIHDAGGLELLRQCARACDRAEELGIQVDRDGCITYDQKGVPREHPCIRGELNNRAFVARALARLGVLDESIKSIGRPATGRLAGWKPEA